MSDVMLDLETLGTGANAPILSIGAVVFDVPTRTLTDQEFYRRINLKSTMALGAVPDPSTIIWWMQQSDAARAYITNDPGGDVAIALDDFSLWCAKQEATSGELRVWGNGAAFDNVLLATTYRLAGKETPWKFWNDRCYRTIKSMYPEVQQERVGVYHNPVDDAKTQALHLLAIFNHINYEGE